MGVNELLGGKKIGRVRRLRARRWCPSGRKLLNGDSALAEQVPGNSLKIGEIAAMIHGLVHQCRLGFRERRLRFEHKEHGNSTEIELFPFGGFALLSKIEGDPSQLDARPA